MKLNYCRTISRLCNDISLVYLVSLCDVNLCKQPLSNRALSPYLTERRMFIILFTTQLNKLGSFTRTNNIITYIIIFQFSFIPQLTPVFNYLSATRRNEWHSTSRSILAVRVLPSRSLEEGRDNYVNIYYFSQERSVMAL